MAKLKKCPFCGSEAEVQVTQCTRKNRTYSLYTPRCKRTSCCGRLYKKYAAWEYAEAAWNRRADNG